VAKELRVGFIGGGNMAGAMIDAVLQSGLLSADSLSVFDPNTDICDSLRAKGLRIALNNSQLAQECDIVFLAVKPQIVSLVLPELCGKLDGKCLVSIAAGVSVESLRSVLGPNTDLIRVLPNTPMLVMRGATVIANPKECNSEFLDLVVQIFHAAGMVEFLDESLINAVIPVSSSSPAFFFRFVRAMAESATKNGIPYGEALRLAIETMHGAAHMMRESGKTPDELIAQVSSKGGTTVAALSAFDDRDFEGLMDDAFARCINRANELGKQ